MFVKLLLRRAYNYSRLEMFEEAVCDYKLADSISSSDEIKSELHAAQKASMKPRRKDYYEILVVAKKSSATEVNLVNVDYESL